jgi:hypothetical protein
MLVQQPKAKFWDNSVNEKGWFGPELSLMFSESTSYVMQVSES